MRTPERTLKCMPDRCQNVRLHGGQQGRRHCAITRDYVYHVYCLKYTRTFTVRRVFAFFVYANGVMTKVAVGCEKNKNKWYDRCVWLEPLESIAEHNGKTVTKPLYSKKEMLDGVKAKSYGMASSRFYKIEIRPFLRVNLESSLNTNASERQGLKSSPNQVMMYTSNTCIIHVYKRIMILSIHERTQ